MLTIQNLKKQYTINKKSSKLALNGVSFELSCGLYGLLGPNGAGKSTLINIITGSLAQTSGKVFWNDKSTTTLGKKFRAILGYMPQQQSLYDSFTGVQFLTYLCALKEIKPADTAAEVQRVASLVNLSGELSKKLSAYSGGMKQRLLAAAALLGDPKLIIMDEPTAGLDPKERVRLRETLSALAKDKIILVATHVVSDVESVASEIILLKDGNIVDKASPADLCEKYAKGKGLEEVYLNIFGDDYEPVTTNIVGDDLHLVPHVDGDTHSATTTSTEIAGSDNCAVTLVEGNTHSAPPITAPSNGDNQ